MAHKTLPCPFCGRHPDILSRAAADYEGGTFVAFASCRNGGYSAHVWMRATGNTADAAEHDVVQMWNTRHREKKYWEHPS